MKAPEASTTAAAAPVSVPVPPLSVAPPLVGETNAVDVAAQLSAATAKANDPRLPAPASTPQPTIQEQQQQTIPAPVSAQVPEMPQMPQMPTPGPPQPSYNVKEDGYVLSAYDRIESCRRIYRLYLSSIDKPLDSRAPARQICHRKFLVRRRSGSREPSFQQNLSTHKKELSLGRLGRLGLVLAKGRAIYSVHESHLSS